MDLANPTSSKAQGRAGTSLGQVLDALGTPTVRLLTTPGDRDLPVRAMVLHDPAEPLPDGQGALLLGVGVTADDSAQTGPFVAEAAARRFCGLVVKSRGADLGPLVARASAASLAVVQAADEVSWRQLDLLLSSVLESRDTAGERVAGAGEELFALANATAAAIGGSVAIEDLDRRVLAYSSLAGQRIDDLRRQSILDRQVPLLDRHLAQYGAVLAARGVVRFSQAEVETPRAAIAVRAGAEPLGTVWAIEGEHGLGPVGEQALIDAGRLAALPLLRRRHAAELGTQARESALRATLDGDLAPHDVAFRLGLPPGCVVTLLGFALRVDPRDGIPLLIQLGAALARHFAVLRPDVAVAVTARTAYALVPQAADQASPDAAARLAQGAVRSMTSRLADHVAVGVSAASATLAEIPELRQEVDDVLRVLLAVPALPQVAALDAVRPRVLLAHVAGTFERLPRLRDPAIEEMLAHDAEHHTDYAPSVLAWLEASGDVGVAAQRLGVHANTVRYRLRRAADRFGVRLDDADTRLTTWLQLRSSLS